MKDTIDRQAAIIQLSHNKIGNDDSDVIIQRDIETIKQLPPAQPKKGKWIKTGRWGRVYYCDQCRNYLDFDGVNVGRGSANWCPNCGADMRGGENG